MSENEKLLPPETLACIRFVVEALYMGDVLPLSAPQMGVLRIQLPALAAPNHQHQTPSAPLRWAAHRENLDSLIRLSLVYWGGV